MEAYCNMFNEGHATCAETLANNVLIGGCYGIKIADPKAYK
jgi:Leu/Phe-tRNA-protein transferase